jgi:PAS domain S-box-containing protein
MIVVVDRDYRYLLANRAFLNFRGLEREQLIGRLVSDVLGPEAFDNVANKLSECLAGKTIQYEMRYRFPDDRERDLLISYFPIEGRGGIDRVACVLHDITERKQAESRLRRSEEKFKTLFAIAPVGIAFLDSRANIVDCNPALERMTRLSREELLGAAWQQRTFLNADGSVRQPGERVSERVVSEKRLVTGVETGAVMEDGDIVWAEVSVAPLFLPDARAVVITQDITERKRAAEELEEANRQLRVLSRQLFRIQEEERRHLAQELHDEIGQTLTAAKINLKIIAPDVPARVSGRLDDSIQLLDRLLRQVRHLSLDLRPPLLDELGLVPTLRWLVDQQAQRAALRMTFTTNVNGLQIDPDVQTTCFRVAQEAITNVIRHSGAKNVAVELRCEGELLTLSVRDDGTGFDPAVIQQRTHDFTLGLVSMKERALLARGGLEVRSALGQGAEIRAWFPLPGGEYSSDTKTT